MIRTLLVQRATTFKARFWSLKLQTAVADFIYFLRCKAVHTLGVKMPLDLIWINHAQQLIRIDNQVPPFQIKICTRAAGVLEKPSRIKAEKIRIGDVLKLQGQALLETAVVMPVLFLLLFGFIELSLMLQAQQKLTHAVHWSTQVGSLTNNDEKIMGALLDFYESDEVQITINNKNHISDSSILSADRRQHDLLQVALIYPYDLNIPFFSAAEIDLNAQASARVLCQNSSAPYQCD